MLKSRNNSTLIFTGRNRVGYLFFILLFLFSGKQGLTQAIKIHPDILKQTFIYAEKDTFRLGLDVYSRKIEGDIKLKPCVIFIFGGAFIGGHRDDSLYNAYFNSLAENDYIVVSISYRLGLRGVKHVSKFNISPLRKAVSMAVEDTYDATNWIIANAGQFGIDTSKIIISGSSSGAITALMSDYEKRNQMTLSNKLPTDFEYAGVVAFAGAVLSFDWGLKYKIPPAPTIMFQGTADRMVPYDKIRFLNKGLFGTSWIASTFKEKGYPFYIYRAVGLGHEMSVLPMINQNQIILNYLDKLIINRERLQVDMSYFDPAIKPIMLLTPAELFKKLQNE